MVLGIHLAQLRERMQITQEDMANTLGMKQSTIAGMERKGRDVKLSTLKRYVEGAGGKLTVESNCQMAVITGLIYKAECVLRCLLERMQLMKMTFGFTNIYFLGDEHFEQQNWNKISFDLGGYENELVCNIHKSDLAGLRGCNRTTCMLYCIGSGIDETKLHARSIARLLSFALDSHCYVSSFRTDEINVPAIFQPARGCAIQRNPVIDDNDGKAMKSFLTQTYGKYRQLRDVRSLDAVIELFNLAENEQPMELQLATVFILLENLKATYAKEKGYIREQASYYKTEVDRRGRKRPLGFKKVLENMFKGVGMTSNGNTLKDIVDLRNDIIHTAMSELPSETQRKRYVSCRNLIAEYLLRLLGYRGKFNLYDGRGISTKLIE